jgi:hypothetical protein
MEVHLKAFSFLPEFQMSVEKVHALLWPVAGVSSML